MSARAADALPTLIPLEDVAASLGKDYNELRAYLRKHNLPRIEVHRYNWRMRAEHVEILLAHLNPASAGPTANEPVDRDKARALKRAQRVAAPQPRRTAA